MGRVAHLRSLLDAHRPTDPRERAYLARMQGLLERGESCFARDAFDPGHFTASSFVLSPDDGALLLILHAKLGLWLQPGGHLEPHDANIVAAACRELSEEVGLTDVELVRSGILDVDIHTIPSSRDPAHEHFDVRFLFRAHDLRFSPGSDAKEARWVSLDEVPTAHSDASVMRAVERIARSRRGNER